MASGNTAAMEYTQILYEVDDRVATITLNRPDRLNAFTWRMGAEWSNALARADEDDAVRAVVITGAGRAFCAGADMAGGEETFSGPGDAAPPEDRPQARREIYPFELRKPVIAAINGHAIGVGLTFPMMCDVRYVANDAKLAFAFVRRGVIPELGSHAIVPRLIGLSRAAELMLSGRTITGREAAALGLASQALPSGEVVPAAMELAQEIATNAAPASVAITKQLLWSGISSSVPEMMAREAPRFLWVSSQPDSAEGVMSFVEKRPPDWKLTPSSAPDFDD